MVPPIVKAGSDLLVKAIDDGDMLSTSSSDNVLYMGDGVGSLEIIAKETVELPLWVEEVVVRVDQEDCCVAGVNGRHYG